MTPTKYKMNKDLVAAARYFGWKHRGQHQFEKNGRKLDLSATAGDRASVAYTIALKT